MAKLLGIDVGTSGCRALLIDESGNLLKEASASYPMQSPRPGWTEQNPSDWAAGVDQAVRSLNEPNVDAIGLTGQMHGSVFLDRDGEAICPALLWNDQRTADQCVEIDAKVGADRVRQITGNPPLTGFQAPKILWLRDYEPDAFDRLAKVLLPKDYVRFLMSGEMASDASDSSGTGLLDLEQRTWSDEMLNALGLPASLFPVVTESTEVTSTTRGGFGGLADGIPIVGGAGDQAAAGIGLGILHPGPVSLSLGTSGVVFTALDHPQYDPEGRVHTFCHANGKWLAMGVMLSCGGAVEWAKSTICPEMIYAQFDGLALTSEPGSNGVVFKPYLAGERSPIIDPKLRGAWLGLSLSSDRASMVRAVLEGVSFGLKGSFEVLQSLGVSASTLKVTSGGSKSKVWLQILADIFQLPIEIPSIAEGPAYGAALLAGKGFGAISDIETVVKSKPIKATVLPSGLDYGPAFTRFNHFHPR